MMRSVTSAKPVAVDGLLSPLYTALAWTAAIPIGAMFVFQNKGLSLCGSGRFDWKIYRCTCRGDRLSFVCKDVVMLKTILLYRLLRRPMWPLWPRNLSTGAGDVSSSFIYRIIYLLAVVPVFLVIFKYIWI